MGLQVIQIQLRVSIQQREQQQQAASVLPKQTSGISELFAASSDDVTHNGDECTRILMTRKPTSVDN